MILETVNWLLLYLVYNLVGNLMYTLLVLQCDFTLEFTYVYQVSLNLSTDWLLPVTTYLIVGCVCPFPLTSFMSNSVVSRQILWTHQNDEYVCMYRRHLFCEYQVCWQLVYVCLMSHTQGICVVSTKYGDSVCEPEGSYRIHLFCFFRRRFIQIAEFWKATSSLHLWLTFQALYQMNQKQRIFKLSFQRNGTLTTTNQYVCI